MTTELLTCTSCGVIFEDSDEREEHIFKTHINSSKGLKRAMIWAKKIL